ncbi:hypothetical protein MTO96_050933 [Rhipicephalus appendiculatus]
MYSTLLETHSPPYLSHVPRIVFRPRIFVDVETFNISTTVLGHAISFPVGLAPSAAHKMAHPKGETGSAKGKAFHHVLCAARCILLSVKIFLKPFTLLLFSR